MKAATATMEAATKNGRKKRKYETPELRIAIISVSFASFDVNQITERNKNIGNNRLAK